MNEFGTLKAYINREYFLGDANRYIKSSRFIVYINILKAPRNPVFKKNV